MVQDNKTLHEYCGHNLHNIEALYAFNLLKQFQSSSLKVVSAEQKLSFNFTFESYGWERSYGFLALWREVEDSEERGASDSDNYFVSYPATFIQGKDPSHSPMLPVQPLRMGRVPQVH